MANGDGVTKIVIDVEEEPPTGSAGLHRNPPATDNSPVGLVHSSSCAVSSPSHGLGPENLSVAGCAGHDTPTSNYSAASLCSTRLLLAASEVDDVHSSMDDVTDC